MTIIKGVAIVALLVGGTSLAMAQNGPATGGQPPVAGGAAGNPANAGPPGPGIIPHDAARSNMQSAAPPTGAAAGTRMATGHHRNMYMSTKGGHHKPLKTGQQLPKQPQ
jgi:hypothetical protein